MLDVIYVMYNSEKWIDKCLNSWLNVDYDLKKVNIYLVDNNSNDNSVHLAKKFKVSYENIFSSINIIEEKQNWGFGKANNIGFSAGKSDIVCFFNIDTELLKDTISELEKEINKSSNDVAVWELRQLPYEHPKMYDAITVETSWFSGAAFAIKRDIYYRIGGFDEKMFMYSEDVDLSWRLRAEGYQLKYVPRVRIYHYCYENENQIKPNQYVYGIINNLYLRLRFGNINDTLKWYLYFIGILLTKSAFKNSKKIVLKEYFKHFGNIKHFIAGRKYKKKNVSSFMTWDYSLIRDGGYYYQDELKDHPLVSIIVRTCGRPDVLRECLLSLSNQTYDNIEIVVVEDGINLSEGMIKNEFPNLNIQYKATGEKVGRSKAGNIGMSLANGVYLNFLDDDDLFFADHVEILVGSILKNETMAVYATSYETPIVIQNRTPYKYEIKGWIKRYKKSFDRVELCYHNYIPIQCIMFKKELFECYGGLDETVDALEDWDMWLRYSLHTDFSYVEKTTSIYRIPANKRANNERQKELDNALSVMREKHKKYMVQVSANELAKLYGDSKSIGSVLNRLAKNK